MLIRRGIVSTLIAEFEAKPIWETWTDIFPVPADKAGVLSALFCKVQVKLERVPNNVRHFVPKNETWISFIVNWRFNGSVTEIVKVAPDLLAVATTGVAAPLN